MIIEINRAGEIVLNDTDNFKAFTVIADGKVLDSVGGIARALDGLGTLGADEKHVWIDPKVFIARLGASRGEKWAAQFNTMVVGAAKYGFVDEKTGAVRAHIERA